MPELLVIATLYMGNKRGVYVMIVPTLATIAIGLIILKTYKHIRSAIQQDKIDDEDQ